jgi:hypothetical protein
MAWLPRLILLHADIAGGRRGAMSTVSGDDRAKVRMHGYFTKIDVGDPHLLSQSM